MSNETGWIVTRENKKCPNCGDEAGWSDKHKGYCFNCWNTGVADLHEQLERAVELLRRNQKRGVDGDPLWMDTQTFLAYFDGQARTEGE